MRITSRRKATITFLVLGVGLAGVAVAVGFGWIILNWREGIKVFLGVIFFGAITAGLVLNTIFLLREIRRNEQHDSFINAVTHELKTPIASIRLYLQTLQHRDVDEAQRREFYRRMLDDSDRLLGTVEQVLKAGVAGHKKSSRERVPIDLGTWFANAWKWRAPGIICSPKLCASSLWPTMAEKRALPAILKSCAPQSPTCSTMPSSIPETRWMFPSASSRPTKSTCG